MTQKRKITPLAVAIHRPDESPCYGRSGSPGEGILHVELADEGGGFFVILKQLEDDPDPGIVRLELEEVELLADAVNFLLANRALVDKGAPTAKSNSSDPDLSPSSNDTLVRRLLDAETCKDRYDAARALRVVSDWFKSHGLLLAAEMLTNQATPHEAP